MKDDIGKASRWMRTLAHSGVSLLAGILAFALTAVGMGGVDMAHYWATAFDPDLKRYALALGVVSALLPVLAAIAGFLIVFHRLRHKSWLPRKAT